MSLPQPEAVVSRIAGAVGLDTMRFAAENRRLSALGRTREVKSPQARHTLSRGVWIDYENDRDVDVTLGPGERRRGLRMNLHDKGDSRWFTFSYALNRDAVKSARFIGIVLGGRSRGMTLLRPCLRHYFPDGQGFLDQFFYSAILLPDGESEQIAWIRPDAGARDRARHFEILFFCEGRAFDVTLTGIENLHI